MKNKQKVKPQPRHLYGCRRINCFDQRNTLDPENTMHEFFPSSYAKVCPLISKFQAMYGDICFLSLTYQPRHQISPMFEYLMERQMLFDYINYDFQVTGYTLTLARQQKNQVDKNDKKKAAIDQLVDKIYNSIKITKFEQNERQLKLKRFKQIVDDKDKLQYYVNKYIYMLSGNNLIKKVLTQTKQLVKRQFEGLKSIELLRPDDQIKKLDLLCKKYKNYFSTEFKIQTRYRPNIHSVKISRPSIQSQPVLIKLSDLIEIRSQQQNNKSQSIEMIRNLLQITKQYYLKTSLFQNNKQKTKQYYEYLNPENLIFDQISLRLKLSSQPIIEDMFGLRNKPLSIQCRLAFFSTPKEFDYFQSQEELDDDKKMLLDDPFYGNVKMYRKVNSLKQELIQKQRIQLQEIKQKMFVDRFLLTSYYMIHKNYFGKIQRPTSYRQIKEKYKQQLSLKKKNIQKNSDKLEQFLGVKNQQFNEFTFKFQDLVEYLSNTEQDSFLYQNRFQSKLRLFDLKYRLIRGLVKYITNGEYFHKIINVKKYVILFFILAIQYFQEFKVYLTVENDKYEEIPQMKLFLQKNGDKLKNKKGVQSSLQSTFLKINDYKSREDGKKFFQDQIGKKTFKYVSQFYQQTKLQKQNLAYIIQTIEKPQKKLNTQQKIKDRIKKMLGEIQNCLTKYKKIFFQFLSIELQLRYKNPHRVSDKLTQASSKITTDKFLLIVYTFTQCSKYNFIMYETLLLPLFKLDQLADDQRPATTTQKETNKEKKAQKQVLEEQQSQRKILFEIDTILKFTDNRLRNIEYLTTTKQGQNIKEY